MAALDDSDIPHRPVRSATGAAEFLAQIAPFADAVGWSTSMIGRWSTREDTPVMEPRIAAEIQFGLVESVLRDCFLRSAIRRAGACGQMLL